MSVLKIYESEINTLLQSINDYNMYLFIKEMSMNTLHRMLLICSPFVGTLGTDIWKCKCYYIWTREKPQRDGRKMSLSKELRISETITVIFNSYSHCRQKQRMNNPV